MDTIINADYIHIMYDIITNENCMIILGDHILSDGPLYRLRILNSCKELISLDMDACRVVIPGFRGDNERNRAEGVKRLNKYKRKIAKQIKDTYQQSSERDDLVHALLSSQSLGIQKETKPIPTAEELLRKERLKKLRDSYDAYWDKFSELLGLVDGTPEYNKAKIESVSTFLDFASGRRTH